MSKENVILQKPRRVYLSLPKTVDLRGEASFLSWLKKMSREMHHANLAQTLLFIARQKYNQEQEVQNGMDS